MLVELCVVSIGGQSWFNDGRAVCQSVLGASHSSMLVELCVSQYLGQSWFNAGRAVCCQYWGPVMVQ